MYSSPILSILHFRLNVISRSPCSNQLFFLWANLLSTIGVGIVLDHIVILLVYKHSQDSLLRCSQVVAPCRSLHASSNVERPSEHPFGEWWVEIVRQWQVKLERRWFGVRGRTSRCSPCHVLERNRAPQVVLCNAKSCRRRGTSSGPSVVVLDTMCRSP